MSKRLPVAARTRLETVWYDTASGCWQVWTAAKQPNADFDKMEGTYMLLRPNGTAARVTVLPDGTEHVLEVLE